jgi:hypothetical protein
MTEDQYLDILISCEPIFEQAAQLALDLRGKVPIHNKSATGVEGVDIVTGADLQVQEFILSKLAETALVECELFAEEATTSVSKFKGTNGLVLLIDPIDGTAKYVSGGKFFSIIISMHNKKDLLYTYYRFPLLGWTKRIVKDKAEDIGNVPEIQIKPGVDTMSMIAYLEYIKPDKLPPEVEDILKARDLSLHHRKEIVDEGNMISLMFLDQIAGVAIQNPVAYDCLGSLHYARATGRYEIYSTLDLSNPMKGQFGIYYPGLYVVWRK